MAGGLTIYGPSSGNFDEALQPALISDWTHDTAPVVFLQELTGSAPVMDNILFNGNGSYICSNEDPKCCSQCSTASGPGRCIPDPGCAKGFNPGAHLYTIPFRKGRRYLLRLINASSASSYIFSIDGHDLEVIATDLVPIQPYKTDNIFLGIGKFSEREERCGLC